MTSYNKLDLSSSYSGTKFFTNDILKKKSPETSSYHPERDNFNFADERYTQLKKLYDERINALHNHIKVMASKFENDEILNTMKNDAISNEFILQRVKEIVDINMVKEKEETIRKLSEDLADLRAKLSQKEHIISEIKMKQKLENEENERKLQNMQDYINAETQSNKLLESKIKSLQGELETQEMHMRTNSDSMMSQNNRIITEFNKLKKEYEIAIEHIKKYDEIDKENDQIKVEIERLKKVISVLEIDCMQTDEKLKEKQVKNETLHEELTCSKNQLFDFNLQIKKLSEENRSLNSIIEKYENERKTLLEKYSSIAEDVEKNSNLKLSSIEQMYKDKNLLLKKKIIEQKTNLAIINEQLNKEKQTSETIKFSYVQKIQGLKDDMQTIKDEWEKKCYEQEMYYEKVLNDLEERIRQQEQHYEKTISDNNTKKDIEIAELSSNFQTTIEEKDREILRLNNETELLKKIENDYIRISKHEEILNFQIKDITQKHLNELRTRIEEIDSEYRTKEEEKRSEYELTIQTLSSKLKYIEKQFEESSKLNSDLDMKLKKESDNLNKMIENYEALQLNLKFQNNQIEDDEKIKNTLRENVYVLEEKLNLLNNSKNGFQDTIESLLNKIKNLENDRTALRNTNINIEESYRGEINNLEENFREYKESQNKKFLQLSEEITSKKTLIDTLEISCKKNQNQISSLEGKNKELNNQNEILQQIINNMKLKMKSYEDLLEELEKKTYHTEKNLKKTKYEKSNTSELLMKILKSKLQAMRDQINTLKNYTNNEVNSIRKEMIRKTGEAVSQHLLTMKLNYDKDLQLAREQIYREFQKKLEEKESLNYDETGKITQRYDKKILDLYKQIETLDNEVKRLKEEQYVYPTRIVEMEKENSRLQAIIANLKLENETLFNSVKHKKYEDFNIYSDKLQQKELNKKNSTILSVLLNMIVKLKAKYLEEVNKLRYDVENLSSQYEAEINNQAYNSSSTIQELEKALSEEQEENARLQKEYQKREEEFVMISKEIEKLQSMYESKVELLTNKISDLKQDNKTKVEKLSESGNFLNYNTNLIKSLKSQIEMKNEELMNSKRDFEALLELKNKKIGELQSSLKSKTKYPTKFSSQIDEEIKGLMKKLNLSSADMPVNDK